ncbi:putative quinol monooxygenase [Mycobacterium deserti]|uniref:Antibiotic biosynthesis monooxygenase n=1 Tax=Mycobacterium deserti TaxID=2978347 RepID=A0ABT2M6V1_9MYCO|nr:antibiotic biosynthesis monooxygenase [Mycobacterium deserti]MCT7657998.1 antibiotic biosynthesis monooxygenase [Mycobacterium deserti]
MATINRGRQAVTLVVILLVDPDLIDEKIAHVIELGRQHSKEPGFVSCAIHRSADNSKILEYIQWETMEHLNAMRKTFVNESPQPPDFAFSIEGTFYEVAAVIHPAPEES